MDGNDGEWGVLEPTPIQLPSAPHPPEVSLFEEVAQSITSLGVLLGLWTGTRR